MLKERITAWFKRKRAAIGGIAGAGTVLSMSIPAFAATPLDSVMESVAITDEMLNPLVGGVSANVGVILPIGVAIMAILIGVKLIPKIIGNFTG